MFVNSAKSVINFLLEKKVYFLLLILLFATLVFWGKSTYNFSNVSFDHPEFKPDKSYFVEFGGNPKQTLYTYKATISYDFLKQSSIRVIPDDCVKQILINGTIIDLSKVDQTKICDVSRGFEFDISKYLNNGGNDIEFQITDVGGRVGIKFVESYYDTLHLIYLVFTLIWVTLIFLKLVIDLKFSRIVIILFILALILKLFYFANTEWYQRTHDVWGHLPFIEYVETKLSLPSPTECWECHQEPLYYVLTAGISKVFKFTGIENNYFIYKIFSLESEIFFALYLIFGLLIMRLFNLKKYLYALIAFIFLFWPTNILHATRIGNDPISYLVIIVSLFFAVKFYQTNLKKYFFASLIFVMLATLTKLTGIAFLPIILVEYIVLNHPQSFSFASIKSYLSEHLVTFGFTLVILILGLLMALQEPILHGFSSNWLTVNVPGDSMLVGNNFNNWVYIDLEKFLTQPNINTFEQSTGSKYFLHTLLKTSMFGEFGIDDKIGAWTNLARIMSALLLVYFATVIFGIFVRKFDPKRFKQYLPLIMFAFLSFGALVYFRFKMTYTPNQDFRYILPILLPFILLNTRNLDIKDMQMYEIISLISLVLISFLGIAFVGLTIFL